MQPSPLSPPGKGRILAADSDLEKYCALAVEAGATHAKQIHPSSVVTAPLVRLKATPASRASHRFDMHKRASEKENPATAGW